MYVGPGQPGADPDPALTRPGPFFEGQGHSIGGPALRAWPGPDLRQST